MQALAEFGFFPVAEGEGIGALIALCLYIWFIYALVTYVGPTFLAVTAILFSLAAPIAYVRSLAKVFGQDDPHSRLYIRNYLLIFVVALVGLVHCDLLLLAASQFRQYIQYAPLMQYPFMGLSTVVGASMLNAELITVGRTFVEGSLLVLFSASMKCVLIVPLVLWTRGFASDIRGKDQPAFVDYFQAQALVDLQLLLTTMFRELRTYFEIINRRIMAVTAVTWYFLWPLTILAYIALALPLFISIVSTVLFSIFHAIGLLIVWVIARWLSLILSWSEWAVIRARAGYAKCPHALCHESVPLPTFLCPSCNAKHSKLVPGRFGVISRACECGNSHLPTLYWRGKGRLDSECPKCNGAMNHELFGGSVHIPIYGGPSTGKTMYMMAATYQTVEGVVPGVEARLIDEKGQREYRRVWKRSFEGGMVPQKTRERFPDAFLLSMQRPGGLPASIYLYDPAGEALQDQDALDSHGFLKYLDGLILMIDPLTLRSFADRYRGPNLGTTTSPEKPKNAITRVINQLARLKELSQRQAAKQRVAVVLSKADIMGLDREIGIKLSTAPSSRPWAEVGLENSAKIDRWFQDNEPHLHQLLKTFKQIRYFAVSAAGHAPQSGQPFRPAGVMDPLMWLLSKQSIFARPRWGKFVGRLSEVSAVAAVLGLLVVLPAAGVYFSMVSLSQ